MNLTMFEKNLYFRVEEIMSGKNLKDHGFEHVKRVVKYTKKIIQEEGIDEKHVYDILTAAYWHDTGRKDDSKDDAHGIRSAELFEQELYPLYPFLDFETIMFTMENHQNYKPKLGGYPIVSNYQINSNINIIVPMVMWDADRLDLPRIERFRGKINTNYLHTDFAKKFANSKEHLAIYEK